MGRKYNDEHVQYLREITPGRYNDEIARLFNAKFGMSATESAIKTLRQKHRILSDVPRARKQYTQEQMDFLEELSERGLFNEEMTKRFNEHFGTSRTENAIQNTRAKYKIKTTARKQWQKGNEPWNKGCRGISYEGMKPTQFKSGHMPYNWVPIGSERITKDGYVQVKIREGMKQKNWRGKHILIWEEHNRPLPAGHAIIFGDGDSRNFELDNLVLVSRAQLVRMNQKGLIRDNADLTRTGAIIADIHNKIGERKRKREKQGKGED